MVWSLLSILQSGEWGIGSGEWGVGSGECGEWGMGSGMRQK
ncbi:hypothetical protein N9414_20055 [Nodularia spumigena CCY9414]|nr:hypothetical protein N9414_01435 [Nodularia spumigena CCY9414]EAW46197.1 hypothetical protein N9414_20055 [Nodularia spumigena CCY9414]